jgi:hypothetical protein
MASTKQAAINPIEKSARSRVAGNERNTEMMDG